MKRKIEVGDWCLFHRGHGPSSVEVAQVEKVYFDGMLHAAGTDWNPRRATKLPCSPSDMAKSHALLMQWWRADQDGLGLGEALGAVDRHCRRLTAKKSRRAGKGK
jgi:hypothetical protein